jgi:hypothetical protein
MGGTSVQSSEIVLVLCHSFFHTAFTPQRPIDKSIYQSWKSSYFVTNLIIERQAELPENSQFATTSKQAFDSFALKFIGRHPSDKQRKAVTLLRNSLYIVVHPSISKLTLDDGVLVICDTLYNRSKYKPVLVSNIPKKLELAEEFYHKKDPSTEIPYPIYDTEESERFLRKTFPELSAIVDARIKSGFI